MLYQNVSTLENALDDCMGALFQAQAQVELPSWSIRSVLISRSVSGARAAETGAHSDSAVGKV